MQMFSTGLKRVMQHEVKQAAPVTPAILLRLSKVVNYRDLVDLVSWTGLLLGFYMFLRKSNLVPEAMDKFDEKYQFTRGDVNLTSENTAMMFEIRWSKTIQFRQRILRFASATSKEQGHMSSTLGIQNAQGGSRQNKGSTASTPT